MHRILVAIILISVAAEAGRGEVIREYMDCRTGFGAFGKGGCRGEALRIDSAATAPVDSCCGGDMLFSVRLRSLHARPGRGYSMAVAGSGGDTLRLHVVPSPCEDPLRDEESTTLRLTASDSLIARAELKRRDFDSRDGWNILRLERQGRDLSVSAGRENSRVAIHMAGGASFFPEKAVSVGIEPDAGNSLELQCALISAVRTPRRWLDSGVELRALDSIASSAPGPCGRWSLLDYDFDDRYMRCSGDLQLLVVPLAAIPAAGRVFPGVSPARSLALIYLSGASGDSDVWQPGMLKGMLTPAVAGGVWRLRWFDSEGEEIDGGAASSLPTAVCDADAGIMTLSFPSRYSTFRLVRNR